MGIGALRLKYTNIRILIGLSAPTMAVVGAENPASSSKGLYASWNLLRQFNKYILTSYRAEGAKNPADDEPIADNLSNRF